MEKKFNLTKLNPSLKKLPITIHVLQKIDSSLPDIKTISNSSINSDSIACSGFYKPISLTLDLRNEENQTI